MMPAAIAMALNQAACATRAARDNTMCDLIGSRACFGGGFDAVLTVYRPTGSSIVLVLQEKLSTEHYCNFVGALKRQEVADRIRNEAFVLSEKQKAATSERTKERLHADAWLLYDLALKFAAPARITSATTMKRKTK